MVERGHRSLGMRNVVRVELLPHIVLLLRCLRMRLVLNKLHVWLLIHKLPLKLRILMDIAILQKRDLGMRVDRWDSSSRRSHSKGKELTLASPVPIHLLRLDEGGPGDVPSHGGGGKGMVVVPGRVWSQHLRGLEGVLAHFEGWVGVVGKVSVV